MWLGSFCRIIPHGKTTFPPNAKSLLQILPKNFLLTNSIVIMFFCITFGTHGKQPRLLFRQFHPKKIFFGSFQTPPQKADTWLLFFFLLEFSSQLKGYEGVTAHCHNCMFFTSFFWVTKSNSYIKKKKRLRPCDKGDKTSHICKNFTSFRWELVGSLHLPMVSGKNAMSR